jgi:protein-disulfide isomerase
MAVMVEYTLTVSGVKMNQFRMKIAAFCVLLLILLGTAGFLYSKKKQAATIPTPVVIDTKAQATMGNAKAPIHIVAFEDLKCINCKRFETGLFQQIKQKYIDTGKAKYTLILLDFIPGSPPAANAAYCLHSQNPKFFFQFVDYIFEHQPPEEQDWATIPTLMEFASHIPGVNQQQFSECLIQNPNTLRLRNNMIQAAKLMSGQIITPSVYINGIRVDPLSLEQVERIIG